MSILIFKMNDFLVLNVYWRGWGYPIALIYMYMSAHKPLSVIFFNGRNILYQKMTKVQNKNNPTLWGLSVSDV